MAKTFFAFFPPLAIIFLSSLIGTLSIRRLANKKGWLAPPREDRWHRRATALHGGLGFFPAFLAGSIWVLAVRYYPVFQQGKSGLILSPELSLALALLIGSTLMFAVGLADDLFRLRPATKILSQLIAASIVVFSGGVFPLTQVHLVDLLLTYLWFVGITNAINMLDNMDGLASGIVILASLTVVLLSWDAGTPTASFEPLAVPLGLFFIAAVFGFWLFNRPPASIFMGDSGSLFIGFFLAGLTLPSPLNGFLGFQRGGSFLESIMALLIPTTVLAIPIFDTTFVTITRVWRAKKPSEGGRDHSSHRLVILGLPEKKTVWLLYGFAIFGGTLAWLMQQFPDQTLPLFGIFLLTLVFVGIYLGHVKIRVVAPGPVPSADWTPLISNLLYKRHAAEVLLDMILVVISFYGAYLLRFEGFLWPELQQALMKALPLVVACCLLSFLAAGIYRGQWRLISVSDLSTYLMGVGGGAILSLAMVTLATRFGPGHSRSAYIVFGILLFLVMVGSRLSFRLFDSLLRQKGPAMADPNCRKVLIYGAGQGGKLLYDEILFNPQLKNCRVVGFVDDDPQRTGRNLCGLPVRRGREWASIPAEAPPEIWISSRAVPDGKAWRLAHKWDEPAIIRRMRVRIEHLTTPLEDHSDSLDTGK